jgi:hypothetical protein
MERHHDIGFLEGGDDLAAKDLQEEGIDITSKLVLADARRRFPKRVACKSLDL